VDEPLFHGGAVDAAAIRYGIPRDGWLDLSTGINPTPYPIPDLAPEYWCRLPDIGLNSWLKESAARYYCVPDPGMVIPAPGSQALIQWLPRLIPPTRVAVVGPTYGEHQTCWEAGGHTVQNVENVEEVGQDVGVVVVVNPNNPDGRIIDRQRLMALTDTRLLVVDEAFADIAPGTSLTPLVGQPNLVILRSIGKFFGLAGMRLGFALTGEPLGDSIERALGPWAVSGPAAAVGAVALADNAWIKAARIRLIATTGRLDGLLLRIGLLLTGGTPLFRLVSHPQASEIFEQLAQRGVLARRFPERPEWIRFGMPGNDADFERLSSALTAWRSQAAPVKSASGAQRPSKPRPHHTTAFN
jgi:cobalamin biosynthetic protein CobC